MSSEHKIIDLINSVMPKSPYRKSVCNEVDSEVIRLGDKDYLFTIDDFSPEDLLRDNDPFLLGWNLACGAISDIIAAGGKPLVYSHAMVVSPSWDEEYLKAFSTGISAALQQYSVSFIGGDLGIGDPWRYTASVIGEPVGKIVNRRGCQDGDAIFLTGKIGAGNLDAAISLYSENFKKLLSNVKNRFNSHEKLPTLIAKYASCAIDTSDGVFAALETISELNGTGFQLDNLPYIGKGILASKLLRLPELLLFLGECGEYEILFTVNGQNKEAMKADFKKQAIPAYELGYVTGDAKVRTVCYQNHRHSLIDYNLKARNFANVKDYLKAMITWVETNR